MGFFTMGFLIGRSGRKEIIVHTEPTDRPIGETQAKIEYPKDYPKDGIRAIDEPSGVIMRPTAQELNQMNEDDATKAAKAEVAKAFENEEPIDL